MKNLNQILSLSLLSVAGSFFQSTAFAQTATLAGDAIKVQSDPTEIRECAADPAVQLEVYSMARRGQIAVKDLPEYTPSETLMRLVVLSLIPKPPTAAVCTALVKAVKNDVIQWVDRAIKAEMAEFEEYLKREQTSLSECTAYSPENETTEFSDRLTLITKDFGAGTKETNEGITRAKKWMTQTAELEKATNVDHASVYKTSVENIQAHLLKLKPVAAEAAATFDKAVKKAQKFFSLVDAFEDI